MEHVDRGPVVAPLLDFQRPEFPQSGQMSAHLAVAASHLLSEFSLARPELAPLVGGPVEDGVELHHVPGFHQNPLRHDGEVAGVQFVRRALALFGAHASFPSTNTRTDRPAGET